MTDPQPPDYKAEAEAWLDSEMKPSVGFLRLWPTVESLAALLERLCGESYQRGALDCRACHPAMAQKEIEQARDEGRREQREKEPHCPACDPFNEPCLGVREAKP